MRRFYRADATPLLYLGTKFDENSKSTGKYYGRLNGVSRADHDPPTLRQYLSVAKKTRRQKRLIRWIVRSQGDGGLNAARLTEFLPVK